MSGAWESRSNSVLCCILHVDTTTIAWSFGFKNLIIPGGFMGLTGMPFDMARNSAAMAALDAGAEWLFFLDSDVVAPPDTILRLMKHKQPIISGVYHRRSPPIGHPVMMKGGQFVDDYPANKIIEVDVVGAGCLLIHTSVLKTLPAQAPGRHWFRWGVDMKGILDPVDCMSEDYTFCIHSIRHGYKVLVDTSIQCKHIGLAESKKNYFGPVEVNAVF